MRRLTLPNDFLLHSNDLHEIRAYDRAIALARDWFAEEYNAPWLVTGAGRIPTVDPATGRPLMFVENVNIGPYLLRKSAYEDLGGFDLAFSAPGEPGITFEAELCHRAWRHSYEVALTDIPVKQVTGRESYILPGGTTLWGLEERERNERANKQRLEDLYGEHLATIQEAVSQANTRLAAGAGRSRRVSAS